MARPACFPAIPAKKRMILSALLIGFSAALLRPPPSVKRTASSLGGTCQLREVAARRRLTEGISSLACASGATVGGAARSSRTARRAEDRPACDLGALEHARDFGKRRVEDVMQQERSALRWRQPIQRQHQRKGKIIGKLGRGISAELFRIKHQLGSQGPT